VRNKCILHNSIVLAIFVPKISKLMEIWQSYDKYNFDCFFRHCVWCYVVSVWVVTFILHWQQSGDEGVTTVRLWKSRTDLHHGSLKKQSFFIIHSNNDEITQNYVADKIQINSKYVEKMDVG